MDLLERKAATFRELEGDAAAAPSSASAFLEELGQQLRVAGTPDAAEQVLARARALWSHESPGGQALLEAVFWDVLLVIGPIAARSRGCQAAVAGACLDGASGCAPREAVTILLAALGSSGDGKELSWGLRLAITEGLAAALPLIPRRRFETFRQAAPILLAGLRATQGDPLTVRLEREESAEEVERWAAAQYPGAVVALAHALLARLQPGDTQLQAALARLALQVLSISTAGLPLAAPARPGSPSSDVPPLLLAVLRLLPPAGLTLQRILRPGQDDKAGTAAGEPVSASDEEGDPAVDDDAEVERGRALAAACLLCLPARLLPCPLAPLSPADRAAAVALAGRLLQGPSVVGSKGLALIAAAAAGTAPQHDAPLEADLLDGVQATLQGLTMLMLLLPEAQARQAAYGAFKAGLSVLPPAARLSTLERFVDTCPHQPVVALLLHLLKEEVARVLPLPPSPAGAPAAAPAVGWFPGERILALVGRTLAPRDREETPGPHLPDEADGVVAALNLYRFLLLREAAVGRSWTGALSPDALLHARTHWLLPLRHVAAQAAAAVEQERQAEAEAARAEKSSMPSGATGGRRGGEELVATVQEVLHRVLELVEDRLQQGQRREAG